MTMIIVFTIGYVLKLATYCLLTHWTAAVAPSGP